ncbi:MAG: sigma-54-dependent Fis family transcriptional regulator, partial [Desulfobacterales bacterium]
SKLNKSIKGFTTNAYNKLLSYAYPGNVRELRNIIEYAANICQGKKIRSENLPQYIFTCQVSNSMPQPKAYDIGQQEEILHPESFKPRTGNWNDIEKEMILQALTKTRGNRSQAAEILGWGRTTLWRKLKMHGFT